MSQTLTDLFEARGSNSVVWQGRQVMALVEIPIGPGDRIRVRRLGSSLVRAQAIKLAVDRGAITVGGYSGPVVALWSHTAPADLLLEVDGPATAIQLWNAWSLDGVDNSWLGNAGIMVDDHGGGLTLQCSDGVGEPDFSDLVVWVSVTSSRPTEPASQTTAAPAQKRQGAPRTSPIAKTSGPPTAQPPSLEPHPQPAQVGDGQTWAKSKPEDTDASAGSQPSESPQPASESNSAASPEPATPSERPSSQESTTTSAKTPSDSPNPAVSENGSVDGHGASSGKASDETAD